MLSVCAKPSQPANQRWACVPQRLSQVSELLREPPRELSLLRIPHPISPHPLTPSLSLSLSLILSLSLLLGIFHVFLLSENLVGRSVRKESHESSPIERVVVVSRRTQQPFSGPFYVSSSSSLSVTVHLRTTGINPKIFFLFHHILRFSILSVDLSRLISLYIHR